LGGTVASQTQNRDLLLVRECLSGSEQAWTDFYCRYQILVRNVVKRQKGIASWDMEDITQNVFVSLMSALKTYDPTFSLPNFICMVAERVCIDEYRRWTAGKRDGHTDPIDHHDSGQNGTRVVASNVDDQEDQLVQAELVSLLRHAFRGLAARCRELLRLRYYEELAYKEIAEILDGNENTLMVQARRCVDDLRAHCDELQRKGLAK
jgi:RNA polymerase sigma factor (sigma-70 family)